MQRASAPRAYGLASLVRVLNCTAVVISRMRSFKRQWLATLILVGLAGCGPTLTYRYKLTIEVDTPDGIKAGSSVFEESLQNNRDASWATIESRGFDSRIRGDAVFIDLGRGKAVIGLLARGRNGELGFRTVVASTLGVRWDNPEALISALRQAQRAGPMDIPLDSVPMLLAFSSAADPTTARIAVPREFEATLGRGYVFRSAKLEIFPDAVWPLDIFGIGISPITRGIEKKSPWWTNTGRPASIALQSAGTNIGTFIEAENLFRRN